MPESTMMKKSYLRTKMNSQAQGSKCNNDDMPSSKRINVSNANRAMEIPVDEIGKERFYDEDKRNALQIEGQKEKKKINKGEDRTTCQKGKDEKIGEICKDSDSNDQRS
ncbi:2754_t:CDS:2 [Acaulospora morrowiae]|uniref:2754_t:CDS:1 n=1 Tax=Acaulospora morrowiae TaxID=94023 RepID=A0A9N9HKA0_9GLOM|nr:2754_t:CDS:2 [Acaulospora morrowiae]